jgi:anaerobic magnesium-protoporphyrin IX monomethyl ester cyclase
MNYLLLMPRGISTSQDQYFHVFAVGIAYVSASMKKAGHRVFTANLDYVQGEVTSVLRDLIEANHIDVVCTGGLSRDWTKIKTIMDAVRSVRPNILCVVGGGIISADPEPAMHVLDADIGVIGEGEDTLCELAVALDHGRDYHQIPGLIFKTNQGLIATPRREELSHLDELPFPDFDGFDYAKFVAETGLAVITCSRSCTYACSFCFRPAGQKYRQRSMENIMSEIDMQISRYHPASLALSDNLFASSRERVLEFCAAIKERAISWGCSLRVSDATDLEMLQQMKAAGCSSINYGLESADNSVLKSMRKGITVEQIETALDNTWKANIHLQANFIFGDPNETSETLANSLAFFHKHKERFLFPLDPIIAFPGAPIYKQACKKGLIQDREQFLKDGCPVINISKLTDLQFKEMLSTITELRLGPRVPAGPFQVLEVTSEGVCKVEFDCRKCKRRETLEMPFWFSEIPVCPSCGTVNHLDPFERAAHLQEPFFDELSKVGTVALWGAGGIYYKLIKHYPQLSSDRYILLDGNTSLHGLRICDKEVHPTALLGQQEIRTVIITALSRKEDIHRMIRNSYPSVQDVLVPDFEIRSEGIVPKLRVLN